MHFYHRKLTYFYFHSNLTIISPRSTSQKGLPMYPELREERIHGTKEFPFSCYHLHDMPAFFQIPVHWHPEVEIIYVRSGSLKIIIEGEEYEAAGGSVYFVNPGELHFMGSAIPGVDYHTLLFPLEFISFQTDDLLETEFLLPLRNHELLLHHNLSHEKSCPDIISLIREILSVRQLPNTLSGHFRLRILLLSLIQKIAACGTINPMGSKRNDPMQREILTYLQYNYAEPLRLETLAEQFHLSEKYLSRYFKQHFHLTLTQYLMHLRLTHACHLLESTSLPVTEVALQSGFPNVSHFIRCFHRTYQMSPLQYRKQLPYQ